MNELLKLLEDGRSRTLEMLAEELHTSKEDILRRIEFLERAGIIRRVGSCPSGHSCSTCPGCKTHAACLPEGGFKNMGEMWERIDIKKSN